MIWVNVDFFQDYLDMVGLSAIFPRVEVFLLQGSPVDMLEKPLMDGELPPPILTLPIRRVDMLFRV